MEIEPKGFEVGEAGTELDELVILTTLTGTALWVELEEIAAKWAVARLATIQAEGGCPLKTMYSTPSGV